MSTAKNQAGMDALLAMDAKIRLLRSLVEASGEHPRVVREFLRIKQEFERNQAEALPVLAKAHRIW